MRFIRAIALLFVSILFFQCQKEVSYIGQPDMPVATPDPLTARLQGTVLNENGQPAQGVTVKVGNQTATTDARGYFRFQNASLDKKSAVVTAEMSGYFKAYRSFAATTGTNQVIIKLIKKALIGSVDAATGGSVTLSNGAKIALPANGVVKASNNSAYTGSVNVYAAYIDPTTSDIDQVVPGSFMANDKNGARVILSSFGMLAVELESSSAEKLQIKSGSAATLTTPIPSSLQSNAPQTIALWSVDETTGIWKEEGTATKQGNVYVGDVKHFSFWNCDVSVNAVYLSMTVKNAAGAPLVYAKVRIKRTGQYSTQTNGYTDSLGQVSGYVPNGEALILEVLDQCNNAIYTQNIGPFSQATNLGVITITNTATSVVTVTGKLLNCSGTPVTSGFAIVHYGYFTSYASVDAQGNFSTNFTSCIGSPATLSITGIDNAAQQQSAQTTVTTVVPLTNAGNITACGTSSTQFFNYTLDGTSYSIGATPAVDSLTAWTMMDSSAAGGYTTFLSGFKMGGSNNNISLRFSHTFQTPGTYTLLPVIGVNGFAQAMPIAPSTVTVTNFPTVPGQFYEGTFSATFNATGSVHTLTGSFKIRK